MLKQKLVDNIVAPVATSHSAIFLDAVVINADEKTNTCDVKYTDAKGVPTEKKGVQIQLHNVNIIDWFPKANERVTIIVRDQLVMVTGPSYGGNYNNMKQKLQLTEDIHSDASGFSMGGYIF